MAGKSEKKQAAANVATLRSLYMWALPVIILSAVRSLGLSRDGIVKYVLLHVPLFGCMYVLEKTGRPKYDARGKVASVKVELNQSGGLTGAMFDVIYTSLFCDAMKLVFNTNAFWYVMLVWPLYWAYQLKNTFGGLFAGARR